MHARTIRYLDDGVIELLERPVSDPGPTEVQIRGGACGICAWDIATARYGRQMHPMAPPGHEGVGTVVKVGSAVNHVKEGDRVAGGGFATLRNVAANRVYPIPPSALPDHLWIVEPVSCVVTGLDHCRTRPGDRVAVIGAGFMGLLLLQGLLHAPLADLVAVDVVASRLALARQFGVAETFDSSAIDRADLTAALKAREFDVVVDTTGHQAGLDLATDIVRRGGLINLFGWIKGDAATFDPTKWHTSGFTVVNSAPASQLRDPFPPAIRAIASGIFDLKPLVTHVAPLADYPALMTRVLGGDPSYVKGVITLD